ncbi:MAG: 5-(carboxyamino)imidazole ribonucleotide synthase [Bryobacteraceae bacterium]
MTRRLLRPGSTIGVFGSGQLGRMFALAARRMDYRVHVFSPESGTPAGQVADLEFCAPWSDSDAVARFARGVDVVTFEFENVPVSCAAVAGDIVPVYPGGQVLQIAQNRKREKAFLASRGVPVAPFAVVGSAAELREAASAVGLPAVLKTAGYGYDGKGQVKVASEQDLGRAWEALGAAEAVLERYIDYQQEVSVVAARGQDGSFAHFGVVSNEHSRHILDVTIAPASLNRPASQTALEITRYLMEQLGAVGLLCVEFFVTRDGDVMVNEIAPRPHNSGHFTIDACVTSQFEQHVRAVCGLPLGSTEQLRPAAMANLLGDLWADCPPQWEEALAVEGVKLHLYGKAEARPGRKMGHLTALANSPEEARRRVLAARERSVPLVVAAATSMME